MASLIAGVNLLGSEQLTAMPEAPEFTSCSIACACFCESSSFGVRQSILTSTPFSAVSFLASASELTLTTWKTGREAGQANKTGKE
jgi:hypothetical protein